MMSVSPSLPPQTILLTENDPQLLKYVCTILRRAAFTVLPARTGEEAIQIESQYPGPIDLLITAFSMPSLSSIELAETLESHRPGLPVLLMSGYRDVGRLAHLKGWFF